MALRRTSWLFRFLTLTAAVFVSEAAEKAQPGGQDEAPRSLFERLRGGLYSELPGYATNHRSHPKTIEISSFAFRVGNPGREMGSRPKRSRWSSRERKLHSIAHGQESPLVIVQSSRGDDAVGKKVFGAGSISNFFTHHVLANDELVKTELVQRKSHKKSDANPFFVVIHRHLHRNNSEKAVAKPVQTSSQTGQRHRSDNETEARVRSAEFAINVIKKAILNKMLKSSHSGQRPSPCKNVSRPVLVAPVMDLHKVNDGDASKDSTSGAAAFELSYEVKVVKFDDGQRWQEDLLAYGSQARQAMDMSVAYVAIVVMTMIALPIAIAGVFRVMGFYPRLSPKNPCLKQCLSLVPAPTGSANATGVNVVSPLLDEPISITVNSYCATPKTRSKAAQPPKHTVV